MFDHVTIGAADRDASRRFYATVLGALGRSPSWEDLTLVEWGDFSIAPAGDGRPVTTGLHVGFAAPGREAVDAFWRAGVEAGYRDDGAPGPRPQYRGDYYGAFLLDPDGNSAEAVVHGNQSAEGIDHLWIRVADLAAARRFHEMAGAVVGFRVVAEEEGLVRFRAGPGQASFTLVAGPPVTTPVHIAFGVADRSLVSAFHHELTAAGYADNGGPGERPEYHPGYFGAFVLDPGGHNVEAVHHTR